MSEVLVIVKFWEYDLILVFWENIVDLVSCREYLGEKEKIEIKLYINFRWVKNVKSKII